MKTYSIKELTPKDIQKKLEKFSDLTQSLLFSRGISEESEALKFLNPDYDRDRHDPFLLSNMQKSVDRILKAIDGGETIAIYSDYDADGIPGAVVLHDFFKKIGYEKTIHYIPMRNEEGFGLNHDAIDNLAGQGVTLLITIDCGIADVEEVLIAKKHNIDFIITDHHVPGDVLPEAFSIINPKLPNDLYPEKMLCGAAVAFKLVEALCLEIRNLKLDIAEFLSVGYEKWLLDMVGLATLSDSVPLLGENRIFAYYGLKVLQKSPRAGLRQILSKLKIDQRILTEDDVAFMLTPRINAASRMGVPHDAFELLSTKDEARAGVLAMHLENKNSERKGLVASMVKEIKKKIAERYGEDEEMHHVLVIGNPEWKPSLLGLVASSFSDEHNRPVFLWGREGVGDSSVIKGSCRAGNGDSVLGLMEKAKDIFLEYGGHRGAGGFSVSAENIFKLEERLNEAYSELQKTPKDNVVLVDKKISIDDISFKLWDEVSKFAPFGFQNPKPLFLIENLKIENVKLFGKEKNHLELSFCKSNGEKVVAIAFFTTQDKFSVPILVGSRINLVATLEKSTFGWRPEVRFRIVDILDTN